MIITCEKCDTRFRLDDARIPDLGARVRCSRCKYAFHVQKAGIGPDDLLAEVVAEATHPGALSVPQATHDLPGPGETNPGLTSSLEAVDGGEFDEEQDWEFNLDPPGGGAKAAAAAAPLAAPELEPARPAQSPHTDLVGEAIAREVGEASPLDELGSPAEWDFLSDAGAPPSPAPAVAVQGPTAESEAETLTAPVEEGTGRVEPELTGPMRSKRTRSAGLRAVSPLGWVQPAVGPAGVGLVSLLVLCGAVLGLRPPAAALLAAEVPARFELAAGNATGVVHRRIENALAGPIVVVSGDFEVRGRADRGLLVQWVDPAGDPIGGIGIAGPPLAPGVLRERAPEALQLDLARGAAQLARGGAFQAVLGPKPPGAVRYQVVASTERFPTPEAPEGEAGSELEAASATAARLPSPLPSSE